jgi:hypothetical protein
MTKHIGNLMGTHWEQKLLKKKTPLLNPLLIIGGMKVLFTNGFVTIFNLD